MQRSQITTPKSFFIKERNSFYSEWTLSFFREFFQNSTDAGAKNIDITINAVKGRGSFGEIGDSKKEITRIVFADDGVGMTKDILNDVYFSIGQSTKDETSVGGYGRARLMTCFSQDRYSILTQDRFVMGEGPEFVNYSLDEAQVAITKAIENLKSEHAAKPFDAVQYRNLENTISGLESDLQLISDAIANGGYKGCRVDVDIDQSHYDYYNQPTVDGMSKQLRAYMSESQLPVNVTINGKSPEEFYGIEDGKLMARRGASKRTLSVVRDDQTIEFGTVHVASGKRAPHSGKLIVRVDGASMYAESIEIDSQIILEIKKDISREVLTSNRDGLKREFKKSLNSFIAELNIDNTSALMEKKSKLNYTIKGDKGTILATVPDIQKATSARIEEEEFIAAFEIAQNKSKASTINNDMDVFDRGVHVDLLAEAVRQARYNDGILAEKRWDDTFPLAKDMDDFCRKISDGYNADRPQDSFYENASNELKEWAINTLVRRYETQLESVTKEHEEKLRDMNDVHISIVSTTDKTKAAIRRNDPRKWDVTSGKGRLPRALLSSWTVACSVAIETLMKTRPGTPSFSWTTGWVYSAPDFFDEGDRTRLTSIDAMCQKNDDMVRFLLNPVNEDGSLKFSVKDKKDRQRLQALAMHEVAHILVDYHNEAYAGILTDLMMEYDIQGAHKRMDDAVKAVLAAYSHGKATVQPMDDEPGPRPAERLLALATANEPENFEDAITRNNDGTWVVDCEQLGKDFEDDLEPNVVRRV